VSGFEGRGRVGVRVGEEKMAGWAFFVSPLSVIRKAAKGRFVGLFGAVIVFFYPDNFAFS
jgi:hypothetical protein